MAIHTILNYNLVLTNAVVHASGGHFLLLKKPIKVNGLQGLPARLAINVKAEGPGTAVMAKPACLTLATNFIPGSLMPGVPASLI